MCANYKRTKTHEIEFTSLEVYYKTALIERPKEKEKNKKKGKDKRSACLPKNTAVTGES